MSCLWVPAHAPSEAAVLWSFHAAQKELALPLNMMLSLPLPGAASLQTTGQSEAGA